MKFNIGDKVRYKRSVIVDAYTSNDHLYNYALFAFNIVGVENDQVKSEEGHLFNIKDLELVPEEPEFEYGEEIEVRDFTDRKWRKGIFVCKIPGPVSYKFLIVNPHQEKEFKEGLEFTTVNWKHARKRKNELKRSAVAKKFGVSEDFILVD